MAQLEALNLRITGNANGLSAELGKAQRDVNSFSGGVGKGAGGLSALFAGLGGPITAVAAGFAALSAGAVVAVETAQALFQELDKIADKADVANKLAISFTELRGLEFSLGELTGLDTGTIDAALQKLMVGLDEAREGTGKTKEVLDRLGLDAGALLQAGPVEALKQLAEATRRIGDPTAQLAIAYDLFGKNAAGMVGALRGGADAIEESYNFAAKWLGLSEQQVASAGDASDQWARMGVVFEGLVQLTAAEFAPLAKILLEDFLGMAEAAGGMTSLLHQAVTATTVLVGLMKDYAELVTTPHKILAGVFTEGTLFPETIPTFDGKGQTLGEALQGAFTLDSTQDLLKRLEEERSSISELTARNREALNRVQGDGSAGNRFPSLDGPGGSGNQRDQSLTEAQTKTHELQREAEKREDARHAEQIRKLDEVKGTSERVLDAIKNQDKPIPVDL